jgi:hypothetical protein
MTDAVDQVPQNVQDAIARNVIRGDKWLIVNMDVIPPVVVKHGNFTHADWLTAFQAMKSNAENAT